MADCARGCAMDLLSAGDDSPVVDVANASENICHDDCPDVVISILIVSSESHDHPFVVIVNVLNDRPFVGGANDRGG